MAKYNFKAFHIRSMNSSTEEEKKSINQELKDLYANLSPLEHDDVRNYYSTKSIYQFGTWYDEIKSIKNAVEGRRT
mgnify:CR=1 FL=1